MFSAYFDGMDADTTRFEDAALCPTQQDFQTKWLAGLSLARVGVVEHLGELLDSIGMPKTTDEVLMANQDPSPKSRPTLDLGFQREFTELNKEDYELYNATLDSWSK